MPLIVPTKARERLDVFKECGEAMGGWGVTSKSESVFLINYNFNFTKEIRCYKPGSPLLVPSGT